jgi:hypothetical protein
MNTQLFVPDNDAFAKNLQSGKEYVNSDIYNTYKEIYQVFSCIFPEGTDDVRQIWLEMERGPLEAFGDFEDWKESGEVESEDEFEELWKDYYPDETKWYKFQTSKYKDDLYFYFDGTLICSINTLEEPANSYSSGVDYFKPFVDWLLWKTEDEMNKLRRDSISYNSYIQQKLPWSKRYGRIKRKDFWNILGDETIRPDIGLGKEMIEKLKKAVEDSGKGESQFLPEMTSGEFFRICEICYDANNYFKDKTKTLSPLEKYLSMADGRDAGLRKIDPESPKAFHEWYHSGDTMGAHPWEICRGGNSTHISLFISEQKGKWAVRLAGSSIGRVEETARMAVALYENKIPFELWEAEEIMRMVNGTDFIGIVPDTVFPRYCQGLFPKEDRIIDFMNLGFDKEYVPKIVEKTFWYPLEEIKIG